MSGRGGLRAFDALQLSLPDGGAPAALRPPLPTSPTAEDDPLGADRRDAAAEGDDVAALPASHLHGVGLKRRAPK